MAKQKPKQHWLELEPDRDVSIIGISSHVHDYRLCWSLNKALGLHLARRDKDISEMVNGRLAVYATYDHVEPELDARMTLVHNHATHGILIKEQRHADYFLVVDSELAETMPELLEKVRKVEFVLTAYSLSHAQLRDGDKLLQEPQ